MLKLPVFRFQLIYALGDADALGQNSLGYLRCNTGTLYFVLQLADLRIAAGNQLRERRDFFLHFFLQNGSDLRMKHLDFFQRFQINAGEEFLQLCKITFYGIIDKIPVPGTYDIQSGSQLIAAAGQLAELRLHFRQLCKCPRIEAEIFHAFAAVLRHQGTKAFFQRGYRQLIFFYLFKAFRLLFICFPEICLDPQFILKRPYRV